MRGFGEQGYLRGDDHCAKPAISPPGKGFFVFLVFGSGVLFYLFFSILLTAVGFSFGIPITSHHFPLALSGTLLFASISSAALPGRRRNLRTLAIIGLLVSSFALSWAVSRHFFDISYDGQGYHQEALIQLDRGWNPFYEPLKDAQAMSRWLNHYSKGVWIYETVILKATGNMEGAKLFHFWLIAAAFSFTLAFLLRFTKMPFLWVLLIGLLAALNPVAIYQSLSFYLDGQLMSLMVILIVILALIYMESNIYYYILLFMTTAVLVNVKLTAGIYAFMIGSGYLLILWTKNKRSLVYKFLISAGAAAFIGILLFGWSPYITNLRDRGNPLYPALGTDRSDYTLPQFPANYQGRNSLFLLFHSLFARSDNVRGLDKQAHLKIPFTFSRDELRAFTDTNAKQGGFGPLFGGTVLLSFAMILWSLKGFFTGERSALQGRDGKEKPPWGRDHDPPRMVGTALFCSAVILATCLVNPASSLARFIPQMWLFPIFAFFAAYHSKVRPLRILGCLMVWVLLLNNILIGIAYYGYNSQMTDLYRSRLKQWATASEQNPFLFHFGHFRSSNTRRFDEFRIHYDIIESKEDCSHGRRILPNSIILKCGPE